MQIPYFNMHGKIQKNKERYFLNDYILHCPAIHLWEVHVNKKHFFGFLPCTRHRARFQRSSPSLEGTNNEIIIYSQDFAPLER